jgi:hypothetical protein
MKRKDFFIFLGLEAIAIVWAGAVFALLSSRLIAGALASSYFLGFGSFILWRLWRGGRAVQWLTLYPALVHVFVITLPMMITRFLNWDQPFEQVRILGLEGPVFHSLSTWVFTALMIATAIDAFRAKK